MSYKRVNNKGTARKMYRSGITVLLIPCKIRFDNDWIKPLPISILDKDVGLDTFDHRVNSFIYYSCNHKCGYYPHYYVSEEDFEKYELCKIMC